MKIYTYFCREKEKRRLLKETMRDDCTVQIGRIAACYPDRMVIAFEQNSACSGCHAASACTLHDRKLREVTVFQSPDAFSVGEMVYLKASNAMGVQAVVLSFVVPLVLLLVAAVLGIKGLLWSEAASIGLSLGVLACYYVGLSFFRKKLQKKIFFTIEKIPNPQ